MGSVADGPSWTMYFPGSPSRRSSTSPPSPWWERVCRCPEQYFRNNVTAGLTLIETMLAHKVPYLVFSSTAATFGEPEYVPIDEAHPQNPTNPYGESKLIVEKMLKWCDLAHGLKFCALRYFNVAGAWHDGSIGEDHRPESHPDPPHPPGGPGPSGSSSPSSAPTTPPRTAPVSGTTSTWRISSTPTSWPWTT